jgi:hypothetical protein
VRSALLFVLLTAFHALPVSGQSLAPLPASAVAPRDNYLLGLTREWAAGSELGDLATREMGPGDVELRYWGGYGLTGTAGVVLRREGGVWKGWSVGVSSCLTTVPFAVGDTMTAATVESYRREARRKCPSSSPGPGTVIQTHVLRLLPLKSRNIEQAWEAAMEAGAPILSPAIGERALLDGYTHVVELRIGKNYRASVIPCFDRPTRPDDFRVRSVAGAIARALPGLRIACIR